MPTVQTLIAFMAVSAVIIALPGPSSLFILAQGVGHGRRAALAATVGIQAGAGARVLLTAAGLSALIASSTIAFDIIRWAGVAYLAFLGLRAFRHWRAPEAADRVTEHVSRTRGACKGLLVALGNPKMMIFYVAFLPQYIDPSLGSTIAQTLVLGTLFWLISAVWDLGLACASGTLGSWLDRRPRVQAVQPRAEGCVYVGLAAWAALS